MELVGEPRPRHLPLGSDRALGEPEDVRDLFEQQPAEQAQLGDALLALAALPQALERLVEGEQVEQPLRGGRDIVREGDPQPPSAALSGSPAPSEIDEQTPHLGRGDGK
jgi:hypothetical protein